MFDADEFNSLDLKGGSIENMRLWGSSDGNYISIGFDGRFPENAECPYFTFGADLFPNEFDGCEKLNGAEIVSFNVSETAEKGRYTARLVYSLGGGRGELVFPCGKVSLSKLRYRGMSYRNMYGECFNGFGKYAYVECEKYFSGEENFELSDGFSVNVKSYADIEKKSPQYQIMKASLRRCELLKDGVSVFSWADTDSSNPREFFDIIHHSDGHRYLPFHIGLYGISYLDLDSGEVYHYIPEGYQHPIEWTYGESFIVTGVFYDNGSDLVAYEGCYWGGTSDVMVGDLSKPLSFEPRLISVHELIDPEYEEIDDIDFARFEGGELIVKCDSKTEKAIAVSELWEKIRSK